MKDEIFILHQPKYAVFSVVSVNSSFPLSQKQHLEVDKLREFSDIFFIFSDKDFPESSKVDKNKFTSLYEGCGWIDCGENLCETFLKTLQYSLEIFEKHVGFCIINLSDLENTNVEKYSGKVITMTASTSSSPVLKIDRLDSEEFYNIYTKKNTGLFKKSNPLENMYCSYKSTTNIVYFKRSIAGLLINFWKSSENNKYIKSFEQNDLRYFIASVFKFLTISTLDSDISDLDIGTLA